MNILVLSTFDVWPPRDGGQTRYVNIWRNFSAKHRITILVYDFRNLISERRYRLNKHVEVVVPRADWGDSNHFFHELGRTGLWLHDVLCLENYRFSDDFLKNLNGLIRESDVVVASHPYLANVAFPMAPNKVTRVYESHNVEFDIKTDYFRSCQDKAAVERLIRTVKSGEDYAARHADLVSAVSTADAQRLATLYGLRHTDIILVPNGANVRATDVIGPEERSSLRAELGIQDGLVGIFLGSAFAANVESYQRAREILDQAGFRGTMLLVGSIIQAQRDAWPAVGFREIWLGFVDEVLRDCLLASADFAFHLMFAGAGTNLKLFDYMGSGTPIIANEFGRRGLEDEDWCLAAEDPHELRHALSRITHSANAVAQLSSNARSIALKAFDWRSVASEFERSITS